MNLELTAKLVDNFPLLYRNVHHFECGDGWYAVILKLSAILEKEIVAMPSESVDPDIGRPYMMQCKEKFAGLRYYMSSETPAMTQAIQEAEDDAANTCEDCGKSGQLRSGGWIRMLCDTCHVKWNLLRSR